MNSNTFLSEDYVIFKGLAGSHSYGTSVPTSDIDYRGIFCADQINVRTPFFPVKEVSDSTEEDTKLYELSHFMGMCVQCNPNIIEMLWIDETDITYQTTAYKMLREHRHELLSSKIAYTTSGYALSQLKRIKGHNKWLNNPQQVEPPKQIDHIKLIQWYGPDKVMPRDFDVTKLIDNSIIVPYGGGLYGLFHNVATDAINTTGRTLCDVFGKLNTNFDGKRECLPPPLAILKFSAEDYKAKLTNHTNYWTWKKNRNAARSLTEEEFGYDVKHAMHLIRLMRMGAEVLTDGQLLVKRPDAAELIDIRNGSMSYDEVLEYANHMNNLIKGELYKNTALPHTPNLQFAAKLLMDIQDSIWSERKTTQ